jgi:hypothetical protein
MGFRTLPYGNLDLDIRPRRNRVFLGGRHLRGRRLLINTRPSSHRISRRCYSGWQMIPVHIKRLTSIVGMCEIVCHQRAWGLQLAFRKESDEVGIIERYIERSGALGIELCQRTPHP